MKPITTLQILGLSKLKAFADDKTSIAKCMEFLLESVGNMTGKNRNSWFLVCLLFS